MSYIIAFSMLILTSFGACLADDGMVWSTDLSWWVEKYPTTTVNKKMISILKEKSIKNVIEKTIPPKEMKLLGAYDAETPIKVINNFMVISKCRPHNCPADFAMIVIDLKQKRIWAGFFSRESSRVSTRWYGNVDDYSVLPSEIKQEFVAKHGG
jgi:hypothetical protein